MKIGVISDIHGNDEKLKIVLDELINCENIYNLGDNAGNNGDSNNVIELLDKEHIHNIIGNHDLEVILGKTLPANRYMAKLLHGSSHLLRVEYDLTDRSRKFIKNQKMEYKIHYNNVTYGFYHSLRYFYKEDIYFENITENNTLNFLEKVKCDIAFVGHKHIPSITVIDAGNNVRMVKVKKTVSFKIDDSKKIIINVGSVGAPRDKNIEYSFATIDLDKKDLCLTVK